MRHTGDRARSRTQCKGNLEFSINSREQPVGVTSPTIDYLVSYCQQYQQQQYLATSRPTSHTNDERSLASLESVGAASPIYGRGSGGIPFVCLGGRHADKRPVSRQTKNGEIALLVFDFVYSEIDNDRNQAVQLNYYNRYNALSKTNTNHCKLNVKIMYL